MKTAKPSDLEMQILSVLWQRGPSTAREVLQAMPDGKKRAYTSVLSVMQVMEKKALLTHTNRGTAHVYSPAVERSKVIKPLLSRLVNEVFAGQTTAMMQALLTQTPVSDDELSEIRDLLDRVKPSKKPRNAKGAAK